MTDEPNKFPAAAGPSADAPPTPGAETTTPSAPAALPEGELARLTDDIIAALKTVYDPEIPSDIYELGLIYKIDVADDRAVASVPGVGEVKVNIVWDPPWDPSRMSEEARAVLNMW
ncbi:MAG TPA: iron-sulfur cluster assembly protein [Xanthobacteraceae bacterium]|nr:iron-sulfur cluster assembly protein [Xanthobacteraceae bacterium]